MIETSPDTYFLSTPVALCNGRFLFVPKQVNQTFKQLFTRRMYHEVRRQHSFSNSMFFDRKLRPSSRI